MKMGPDKSYATLMDEVLKAREEDNSFVFHPLRPSSAGYCEMKLYNDYLGYLGKAPVVKEYKKPSVLRLLSLGHYIEEQVLGELKDIPGFKVRFNQQVVDLFTLDNGYTVEGSTDAVMWSKDTKGVLDAKSVGDRWHNHFASKWEGMKADYAKIPSVKQVEPHFFVVEDLDSFMTELGTEDALYKNIMQVNAYACSPFLKSKGIDHGSILRYNKNNSCLMEVRFKPSETLFQKLKDKYNRIVLAAEQDKPTIVKKERVLGHVDCAYCPYKESCWPSARRGDFYKRDKKWATQVGTLEKGEELEEKLTQYEKLEASTKDLTKLEQEIILLIDGHGQNKVKRSNGEVYEIKVLQKGAVLRRGKE